MLEIEKGVREEEISVAGSLLRIYWKERGRLYAPLWTEQYLRQGHTIELKKEQWFLLKEDGKIIGILAALFFEGYVAELRDAYIKKEHQNKGYKKKIIQHALEWCKINNARKIYTFAFRQEKEFFEQMGFRLEGFLQDHFKHGEDLLIMSFFPEKKQETQVNLKEKLEDMHRMESIAEETSARLRTLGMR